MKPCFVYIFGPLSGPLKIGHAYVPKRRAAEIRGIWVSYLPRSVTRYGTMWHTVSLPSRDAAKAVEKLTHERLHKYRIRNPECPTRSANYEWFDIELAGAMNALNGVISETLSRSSS